VRDQLGFLTIEPKPPLEILSEHYSEVYYQKTRGNYSRNYNREENDHRQSKFELRLFAINQKSNSLKGPRKVLDVGCGEGFMLSFLKHLGFSITGLDYSSEGIMLHNPELLSNLVQGDVIESMDKFHSENLTFDLVIVGNVLEHTIDVEAFLERVKKCMNSESICLITVPNDDTGFQLLLQERKYVNEGYFLSPPEHLNYFNHLTLQKTLEFYGFLVVDLFSEFPIDWFLANPNSNYIHRPETGRDAHAARLLIETFINNGPDKQKILDFYRSMARIGQGRLLNAICKLN
jgi:2-polyprenyl-3-methyl-5-hydroxy-6-metoxy-1,4-benzoquinol methylase